MIDKKWFTLVELIIVVVILSILWTVWFIWYSKYLVWVRDAARQNQLIEIWEWLKTIFLKKRLPLPDDKVEVRVDWEVIAYQWYVWQTVLDIIWYNKDWVDPKTWTYYTYYVSKDRKYFQLLSYLEKDPEVALNIISNTTYANIIDYSFKFISTHWAKLWVLTDEFNTPIQEISSIKTNWYIDLLNENADQVFKATIDNERTYEFS
jgi:prepilin-type N-terminal cleavage/methylation domain-containing protein